MVVVGDWHQDTLRRLTLRHILPGTHVVSDGWAGYRDLQNIRGGIYSHSTVNHRRNFVHPNGPNVHTQRLKCDVLWMHAKRSIRKQLGTSRVLLPLYLNEFIWRRNLVRNTDPYSSLIVCIGEIYNVG